MPSDLVLVDTTIWIHFLRGADEVANYSATTEYIISPSGDALSLKMILYYPSLNKTVTLNGTR